MEDLSSSIFDQQGEEGFERILRDIHAAQQHEKTTPQTSARQEIERRSYELFLERGCTHGRDMEDWLEAERQWLAEKAAN